MRLSPFSLRLALAQVEACSALRRARAESHKLAAAASTVRHDRLTKARLYREASIPAMWLADPEARALEVFALEQGRWVEVGRCGDGDAARIPPFEAIELEVGRLFPPT